MREDWRERKSVFLLLLAAACTIWGYNVYQVARGLERGSTINPADVPEAPLVSGALRSAGTYIGGFRDPFLPHTAPVVFEHYSESAPEDLGPEEEAAHEEVIPLPALRLVGTVGGTALIVSADGQTHYLHAGEEIEGAIVREVQADFVELGVRGEVLFLELTRQPDLFAGQ